MTKRLLLCVIFLLGMMPQTYAVLKEKNLNQTLSILRAELETALNDQNVNMKRLDGSDEHFRKTMIQAMKASDQTSLMLYSQKMDYVFDLTYACNEATVQYKEFKTKRLPFNQWLKRMNIEIARYNGMIESLNKIPDMVLDEQGRKDKEVCLELATKIRSNILYSRSRLNEYKKNYSEVAKKLENLNDYAEKRYRTIRQNIFINGGDPYWTILAGIASNVMKAKKSVVEKYGVSGRTNSEWRGPLVLGLFIFVFFYMIASGAVSMAFIRWAVPKRFQTTEFLMKRSCLILAASIWTFAFILMILWAFVFTHNFFLMASGLLIEYAWLVGAILCSLLIRLKASQIKSGFRVYSPIMVVGLMIIVFRIILIPNDLVSLIFPPLLTLATFWQWNVIFRHNHNIPQSDIIYTWISLVVMIVSSITTWVGYTLLSVQILIWWLMMLTCVQTITLIFDLLNIYEKSRIQDLDDVRQTWAYDLVSRVFVPILGVGSFMISLYWAAHVFELTDWCDTLFNYNFIDLPNIICVSILKLSIVIALWFVTRYVVNISKAFYIIERKKKSGNTATSTLLINIMTILIWGFYVIVSMIILNINNSGIVVAVGGMSTGIGFAMKDTIENLFYGISLMTGRVRMGDTIECDGVRGKVTNINYQSTMVETLDGSVMAFLNSQLFSKNFKNLTRNHGYELVKVPVGVAYGTDVKKARTCIEEWVGQLDCYNKKKGINVLFDNFGDNSVDLIMVVWVPVSTKLAAVSQIKEAVYNAFNANGIEIPFPQRDIYIRQLTNESQKPT